MSGVLGLDTSIECYSQSNIYEYYIFVDAKKTEKNLIFLDLFFCLTLEKHEENEKITKDDNGWPIRNLSK